MDRISELRGMVGKNLGWHKSRLDCFLNRLLSLFVVRSVNLREIAVVFQSESQIDSRYKRIKRFFATFKLDVTQIGRLIFLLFFSDTPEVYLTLDRTNWFFGKNKMNVLTLAVAHEGIAIPIFWCFLNKAGSSSSKEQINLLQQSLTLFKKTKIAGLLADREFANGAFFKWLNQANIPFSIRLKNKTGVKLHETQKPYKVDKLFADLRSKETHAYDYILLVFGQPCRVSASRSGKGELMVIASHANLSCPERAIPIYLRRWEIENLFQALKGRGFRFEETHLTRLDRLNKLMALLALGIAWGQKVGEYRALKKPIPFFNFKDSIRPQLSLFR